MREGGREEGEWEGGEVEKYNDGIEGILHTCMRVCMHVSVDIFVS